MSKPLLHHMRISFDTCEKCEYEGGFHLVLVRKPASAKHKRPAGVILKCPNCGQTYDVGWVVELELT